VRPDEPVYGLFESVFMGLGNNSPNDPATLVTSFDDLNQCRAQEGTGRVSTMALQPGSNSFTGFGGVALECNFSGSASQTVSVQCPTCARIAVLDASGQSVLQSAGSVALPADGPYKLIITGEFGWYQSTYSHMESSGTMCDPDGFCGERYETVTETVNEPLEGTLTFTFSLNN